MKTMKTCIAAISAITFLSALSAYAGCSPNGCGAPAVKAAETAVRGCRAPAATCGTEAAACSAEKKAKKCCGSCGGKEAAHTHDLSTKELTGIVTAKSAILLDARGGKWDDGKRIPGAKSLPSGSSAEAIAAAVPDKSAAIVTYCSNTKCPASEKLAKKLVDMGYTNVKEYPEGIAGWKDAGNKVETAKK